MQTPTVNDEGRGLQLQAALDDASTAPLLEPSTRPQRRCAWIWWNSGPLIVILSAAAYAVAALFAKFLGTGVSLFEVTALQAVFGFVVTVIGARCWGLPFWGSNSVFGSKKALLLLMIRGVLGGLVFILAYGGILLLPLGDAVTTFYTNSAFTALFAWLVGLERVRLKGAFGVFLCLVGTVLLARPSFLFGGDTEDNSQRMIGIACSLSASILCSICLLIIAKLGNSVLAVTVTTWFHFWTFIVAVIPVALGYPKHTDLLLSTRDCLFVLGIAVMTVSGQLLLTQAVQLMTASQVAAIRTSELIFGYVFGAVFWHEIPTILGILGTILIAGGVVAVAKSEVTTERTKESCQAMIEVVD